MAAGVRRVLGRRGNAGRTHEAGGGRIVCTIEIAYPNTYRRIESDVGRRQCRRDEEL
jgi:hypothetical protein